MKSYARQVTVVSVLTLTAVLGAGCDRNATPKSTADRTAELVSPAPADGGRAGFAVQRNAASLADAKAVAPQSPQLPPIGSATDSVTPAMVIRNGNVSIEVDSLDAAITAVRRLAATMGGYVGNISMSTGEYEVRSASLELKIPSARFDEAMNTLSPIGKIENSNTTAQDVSEEFVDVNARVANARRLEDRLVTLLATRTGKLEDVLAVERELARVREEIERYEGRIRFLRSRVSLSTLVVTVHERAPLVSATPGTSVLGEAVKAMWRNFVHFIATIIASLGVLVPIGATAAAILWWWGRGRTSKA